MFLDSTHWIGEVLVKAVVHDEYGPPKVLRIDEIAKPPKRHKRVRVKVHAAALNPKDSQVRRGTMWWLIQGHWPRVPGYDFAGELLDDVDGLKRGEPVYGMIQAHEGGALAEVVSVPPDQLAKKPEGFGMAEAAATPLAALTALQALRDELHLQPGQRVLLNGASGGVGTFAVQIAKVLGAKVTAVCSSDNTELVRGLGADEVVDYKTQDVSELRGFDAVFDIYGSLPWKLAKKTLVEGGRYCTTIPQVNTVVRGALRRLGLHRAALVVVQSRRSDLNLLREFADAGNLRAVVDQVYPMNQVQQAYEHLDTKHARGKVVLRIASRKETDTL